MSFTAWDRGRGVRQLRVVQPNGFPQSGNAAFVLGSDDPGYYEQIVRGDFVQVYRSVDLTAVNFVRARFRLRGPSADPPAGLIWIASITIDLVDETTITVPTARTRDLVDLVAHVSKLTGDHLVGFKLELSE